jgi:GT2 family glycosyltransferase
VKNIFNLSIAVVIVTYQRYNELQKTLNALKMEGFSWLDIYIVDNSQDDKRELNFYCNYKGLNLLFPDENISSSGGFALGMKAAHLANYDWALLFNDDSRPKKGALESFYFALHELQNEKLGLIKIGNLDKDDKAVVLKWKGVRRPTYYPISDTPIACDLVTFDGCFINTKLMDEIGYCDPLYFMGTYEFDYCLRAKEKQFEIFTIPNGLIEDDKLGSVHGSPPWRQYYNTRNHLHLGICRKDLRIISAWFFRELKFTYAILRFQDQKIKRLQFKIKATLDALRGRRGKTVIPH